jgi:hypothetical protein
LASKFFPSWQSYKNSRSWRTAGVHKVDILAMQWLTPL